MKRGENGYRGGKNLLKNKNRQYTTDKNPD